MTLDAWLTKHPYLQPLADIHAVIETAADEISIARARIPSWDCYLEDFRAGVPLLNSSRVAIDLESVESVVPLLVEKLVSRFAPSHPGLQYYLAHCDDLIARPGQRVVAGQVIARSNFPGTPHLHVTCNIGDPYVNILGSVVFRRLMSVFPTEHVHGDTFDESDGESGL